MNMITHFVMNDIQLFHGLPEKQLQELANIAVSKTYQKGSEIFQAGDEANGFYAVRSGKVKIYRAAPTGKEQILHVFGPGNVFGEVPVFQGGEYPASSQALQRSELLFFPRKRFRDLISQDPELVLGMLALLSGRLRSMVNQVAALSLQEVPQRLAAYFLLLSDTQIADGRDGNELHLDMAKGQVASYLGTIQETLSRTLAKMKKLDLIEVQGRVVNLKDRKTLEALASGLEQL